MRYERTLCTLTQFLCLALVALVAACSDEHKARTVDFSDIVQVERPGTKSVGQDTLLIAVGAMTSPKETLRYYQQLMDLIGSRLGKSVELVQRKTYREVNELLAKGEIDLAFLCSGPYAALKDSHAFHLIATPEIGGSHFYQSYLIVQKDSQYSKLEDLKGGAFAFTDPDSNTGRLVPVHWLTEIGERPDTFFRETIYTYSHDNSIEAVARGMVEAAAVDGLVWEYFRKLRPELTSATRIIRKSEDYGIPPLVASKRLSTEMRKSLQDLLFSLHRHEDGRKILDRLMIDRFVEPRDDWYDSIRKMQKSADLSRVEANVPRKHEN